jgi:hypothetical protein
MFQHLFVGTEENNEYFSKDSWFLGQDCFHIILGQSEGNTKHHPMKTYWGADIAPPILDLGTRWM